MRLTLRHHQHGFTLIEVLVMAPILMVVIVIMMSFLFNQYGQLTQQGSQIDLNVESQNITFSMQDDIFFANSFLTTKSSLLNDSYQPSGGWNYNTNPSTLIISTPALTTSRRDPNRQPVYINTLGCSGSTLTDNSPLFNNVIYFASGTNLYKRTLTAPSSMNTCGTSFARQTCPSDHVTSECQADVLVTDKLSDFKITYYDTNNLVTTNPEQAEKIKVDLALKDRAYAEDVFSNSSITLRKLNQ